MDGLSPQQASPSGFPAARSLLDPSARWLDRALALVALGIGSLAAWLVITQLFEFDWLPDWGVVLAVLGLGIVTVLAFALGASLPLLRAKPAQALRTL